MLKRTDFVTMNSKVLHRDKNASLDDMIEVHGDGTYILGQRKSYDMGLYSSEINHRATVGEKYSTVIDTGNGHRSSSAMTVKNVAVVVNGKCTVQNDQLLTAKMSPWVMK